jgi:hypothetical protein
VILHAEHFGCAADGQGLRQVSIAAGSSVLTVPAGAVLGVDIGASISIPGGADMDATIQGMPGAKEVVGAAIDAGSPFLTVPSEKPFVSNHEGWRIVVDGAGPGGSALLTDIHEVKSVTNSTQVLALADNAATTVTDTTAVANDGIRARLSDHARASVGPLRVTVGGRLVEDATMTVGSDRVLLLAPSEAPKAVFVESFPQQLAEALRDHNEGRAPEEQIRLRVALHAGEVRYDDHGVTAMSINLAFRLLDAPRLKSILGGSHGVLAVIVSSWFFEEVVRHSVASRPATYRPVRVKIKETSADAWICLPDQPFAPAVTRVARSGNVLADRSAALPATHGRREAALAGVEITQTLPRDTVAFTGRADEPSSSARDGLNSRSGNCRCAIGDQPVPSTSSIRAHTCIPSTAWACTTTRSIAGAVKTTCPCAVWAGAAATTFPERVPYAVQFGPGTATVALVVGSARSTATTSAVIGGPPAGCTQVPSRSVTSPNFVSSSRSRRSSARSELPRATHTR